MSTIFFSTQSILGIHNGHCELECLSVILHKCNIDISIYFKISWYSVSYFEIKLSISSKTERLRPVKILVILSFSVTAIFELYNKSVSEMFFKGWSVVSLA